MSLLGFNLHSMTTPTIESISSRLRSIRTAKGLSLSDVERDSHRAIRAVVLGSYERGDRALTLKKAITIAAFYGVPLTYLIQEPSGDTSTSDAPVLDLRRLRHIVADEKHMEQTGSQLRVLITFISGIVALRNDWNGEVLSLRTGDLKLLALAVGTNSAAITQLLISEHLLFKAK